MLVPHQRHINKLIETALKQAIMATSATEEKLKGFCVIKKVLWPQHYKMQTFVAKNEMNPPVLRIFPATLLT